MMCSIDRENNIDHCFLPLAPAHTFTFCEWTEVILNGKVKVHQELNDISWESFFRRQIRRPWMESIRGLIDTFWNSARLQIISQLYCWKIFRGRRKWPGKYFASLSISLIEERKFRWIFGRLLWPFLTWTKTQL
jgi:hypothetical protein